MGNPETSPPPQQEVREKSNEERIKISPHGNLTVKYRETLTDTGAQKDIVGLSVVVEIVGKSDQDALATFESKLKELGIHYEKSSHPGYAPDIGYSEMIEVNPSEFENKNVSETLKTAFALTTVEKENEQWSEEHFNPHVSM